MPLSSVVWLMRAFCSWEINPQAKEDAQDWRGCCWGRGGAQQWGRHSSLKLQASVLGMPPSPFPRTGIGLAFGFIKGSEGQDKLVCMGFSFKTQPHKTSLRFRERAVSRTPRGSFCPHGDYDASYPTSRRPTLTWDHRSTPLTLPGSSGDAMKRNAPRLAQPAASNHASLGSDHPC